MKNIKNEGQALVEYVLIIALISVLAISLVSLLGGYLKDAITKSSCGMVGQVYEKGEKSGDGYCKDKELEE